MQFINARRVAFSVALGSFYLVGNIDEAIEKARGMSGEEEDETPEGAEREGTPDQDEKPSSTGQVGESGQAG